MAFSTITKARWIASCPSCRVAARIHCAAMVSRFDSKSRRRLALMISSVGMKSGSMSGRGCSRTTALLVTLRYQFPFVENGSKRPDTAQVAHATVRAAVAEAGRRLPSVPLIAGGKSFGGRMTSQAQALAPLPNVLGLAFVGFPLHPAGRPSIERAMHLSAISIPMLCLQGTRDALAELSLIRATIADLEQLATLSIIEGADHAFHVLARSGRTDAQAMSEMLENLVVWAGVTVGK